MYRYTTPCHRFKLPKEIKFSDIDNLYITYSQVGVLFEKTLQDCVYSSKYHSVEVHLTQDDTAKFASNRYEVEIQMTIKTRDGNRFTSSILKLSIGRVLKEGKI